MGALLTPPTVYELADFTGRDVDGFTEYADRALTDAALLWVLATGASAWPDEVANPAIYQLVVNGVLSMADALYLSAPFARALAKPFTSETIGSYSYSKMATAISGKLPTGVGWFDLAVATVYPTPVWSDAITVFEEDGIYTDTTGRRRSLPDGLPEPAWGLPAAPGFRG
jgi:hypothetical protein